MTRFPSQHQLATQDEKGLPEKLKLWWLRNGGDDFIAPDPEVCFQKAIVLKCG